MIRLRSIFKKMFLFSAALLVSMQVAVAQSPSSFSGMTSTLDKVDIQVLAKHKKIKPGIKTQFAIVMALKKGWHLNAHKPTLDYLIGVNLNVTPNKQAMVSGINYPSPIKVKFEFADQPLIRVWLHCA